MPRRVPCSKLRRTSRAVLSLWAAPQGVGLPRLAGDLMPRHQVEHGVRRVPRQLDHAPTEIGPEVRLDLVGIVLQTRIDLSAVAAGGTPAGLVRFEHGHFDAALCQVKRRR
jgi:hypothetical protein